MNLDFPRLARDHGIPICETGHRHCHAGWIQTDCPFCDKVRGGLHLGWCVSSGQFNCWRCGQIPRKRILHALFPSKNLGQLLQSYCTTRVIRTPKQEARQRVRAFKFPFKHGPLLRVHKQYLRGRGFDPDALESVWQLTGTTRAVGMWGWRIVIPIFDSSSNLVSFTTRAVNEKTSPRYMTQTDEESIIPPKNLLYGEHLVGGNSIIVVEGPADAWRIGPGAVAMLGAGWTKAQAMKLLSYKQRFIVFDPDDTGRKKAESLASWLSPYSGETEIITGLLSDPGDMTMKQVKNLRLELGFS